jgi:hypothetical protein
MSKFSTVMTASLLALAVGFAASPCQASDEAPAFGASYLRMGVGPRALAMGGAGVAAAEDVTAGYWNPAGLLEINWIEAQFMYSDMSMDRSFNYVGYGHHLTFGAVGLTWINAGVSDIKVTREGWSEGKQDWKDNALMASYAMGLGAVHVGANAKVLLSKFGDEDDTGFGLDAGVRFVPSNNLAIGIMLQDIGTQYWGESVDSDLRVGMALKSADQNLTVAGDAEKWGDRDIAFHLGAEVKFCYVPGSFAALRAGMYTGDSAEEETAFTFGGGIELGQVCIDYAYLPEKQDFMNSSHRISLTGRF